jgi:hypothetical protein
MVNFQNEVTADLREWYYSPSHNIYYGRIYNDSKGRWSDGKHIHTSNVTYISRGDPEFIYVKTLNSVYRLRPDDKKEGCDDVGWSESF